MLINIPKDCGKPQLVLSGIYKVLVTGIKVDKSKSSENMLIKPELTIQTQSDANGQKVMGRKLFDNWTVAESSIGIWANHYRALTGNDLPVGEFEIDEFINRITSDIQGKEALVQVEVQTNDQGERNVVKRYTKLG
jgi:hypothetical protein